MTRARALAGLVALFLVVPGITRHGWTGTVQPTTPSGNTIGRPAGRVTAAVAAGESHSCAVTTAGSVRCWGDNFYGQSNPPADLGTVTAVAGGRRHSCAVVTAGGVRCWGENRDVQRLWAGQASPPADLGTVTAVTTGEFFSCALTGAGSVRCWGQNDYGQSRPPGDLGPATAIAAGGYHTCAVTTAGGVRCWGHNTEGQARPPADLGTVTALSAGTYHSCSVTTASGVRCWGYDGKGQSSPPADLGTVTAVSVGRFHTCAVTTAGGGRCWGDNTFGQTSGPADLGHITAIAAGEEHSCAVTTAGTLRCWGTNNAGQLNAPAGSFNQVAVAVGSLHTCGVASGPVACWGRNPYAPLQPPADLGPVREVATGGYHSCAITVPGAVRCWGLNDGVQTRPPSDLGAATALGLGPFGSCAVTAPGAVRCWGWGALPPSPPASLTSATAVTVGKNHVCAVAVGRAVCWGRIDDGDPTPPSDLGSVRTVSAGTSHVCAVTSAGGVSCWGNNAVGQATPPADLGPVSALDAGPFYTCALTTAGAARCWGRNTDGEAVPPADLGPVNAIEAGEYHACAVVSGGRLRCWGRNGDGELGGVVITSPAPPNGSHGVPYDHRFTASVSPGPASWSLRSGKFPPGVSLNSSTGSLSGKPTPGTYEGEVAVSNGVHFDAVQSFSITITRAVPNISGVTNDGPVAEGSAATISVSASHPLGDQLGYAFDCDGDGGYEVEPQYANTVACTVTREPSQPVGVRVVDADGDSATSATDVGVVNAGPIIDRVAIDGPAGEGGTATVSVDAHDPGRDPLGFAFDCDGDGSLEVGPQPGPAATCSFPLEGTRTVGVRVADDGGLEATASTEVRVGNLPPVISGVSLDRPVAEGETATVQVVASDPGGDPFSYAFDCDGDGSIDVGPQPGAVAQCSFSKEGTRTIEVRVADDAGAASLGRTDIEVANAAPRIVSIGVHDAAIDEGSSTTVVVNAFDPGGDPLRLSVDCDGDGDEVPYVSSADGSTVDCFFPYDGVNQIFAIVTDDAGATATAHTSVVARNVAPVSLGVTNSGPVRPGEAVTITASAFDPGSDEFTFSFDCDGDGTADVGPQRDGTATCRFAVPGLYHVGVVITDRQGASTAVGTDVRVLALLADVAVTGSCPGPALPLGTLRCRLSVTNAGPGLARVPLIRLALDSRLALVEVAGDLACTYDDPARILSCTTAALDADTVATVAYTVLVADDVGPETTISSSAEATSQTADPVAVNDRAAVAAISPTCGIDRRTNPSPQVVLGTSAAEVICGSAGIDIVDGGGGDDVIFGLGDGDVILGGDGRDVVAGGDGNDVLVDGGGEDRLLGNAGSDLLLGGIASGTADGGAGEDVCAAQNTNHCELPPSGRSDSPAAWPPSRGRERYPTMTWSGSAPDAQLTRSAGRHFGHGRAELGPAVGPQDMSGEQTVKIGPSRIHDPGDDPEFGGLDWTTWLVFFEEQDGRQLVAGLRYYTREP